MRSTSSLRFRKFQFESGQQISLIPPEWLLIKPISGTIEVKVRCEPVIVADVNNALMVPSMCEMVLSCPAQTELLIIFWLPELLGGIFTLPEMVNIDRRFSGGIPLASPCASQVDSDFRCLTEEAATLSTLTGTVKILDILAHVALLHIPTATGQGAKCIGARSRLFETLETTVAEQIFSLGPSGMARRCSCNPRQFSRLFQEYFKTNFSDLKVRWQVKKASLSLLERDRTLHEIALEAGFFSASLFARAFEKHMRVSPAEWQTMHKDWSRFAHF